MCPSLRLTLSVRRLGCCGIAVAVTTFLALPRTPGHGTDEPSPIRLPSNAALQRARNPVQLTVLTDSAKVLGWVSGVRDHAGEEVAVRVGGKVEKTRIDRGNTFTWPYKVKEPTRAVFAFGRLTQSVTLTPPSQLPPSVFFVLDRSAYRPKQKLRFAGYLRQLDERGEFAPLSPRTVEVVLQSEQKKTTVARMKLTSDEQGRITGEHTFLDTDPLDHYRLSIPGYRGSARLTLAEYRKSKTYLAIDGQSDGARLKVRLRGAIISTSRCRERRFNSSPRWCAIRTAARPARSTANSSPTRTMIGCRRCCWRISAPRSKRWRKPRTVSSRSKVSAPAGNGRW